MAVCTIARARATTVGGGLVARTAVRVSSSQRRTTSSESVGPYWLKLNVDAVPLGLAGLGGGGSLLPATAKRVGPTATAKMTARLTSRAPAPRVFADITVNSSLIAPGKRPRSMACLRCLLRARQTSRSAKTGTLRHGLGP